MDLEDDWYCVKALSDQVFAIGEPLYEQQNWSYLFVGENSSLLFDTGSYFGNITSTVQRRVKGTLTVLPSHMHYDHLGNITRFERIVLPNLTVLRACEKDGKITPSVDLFLGQREGHTPPEFPVEAWLEIGSEIDLGGLVLKVLHTPGHSPDSISLWMEAQNWLFSADFLYPGELYAQTPGASLPDYLAVSQQVLGLLNDTTKIYGAHGNDGPQDAPRVPMLNASHLSALIAFLEKLHSGQVEFGSDELHTFDIVSDLQLIARRAALKNFVGSAQK